MILVVDDDDDVREILAVNLMAEGYQVLAARGGGEALEMAKCHRPALVLLDLMMPDVNGLEVCKAMRADHRSSSATIIMLTASAERGHLFAALSHGADDYVTKPFDLEEVLLRVETGLRRSANLRATSPLTGLPGNAEIARLIDELITEAKRFAFVHADLDNFKAYNDRYGFLRGDEAIRTTAQLLVDAVEEVDANPAFIGHVGGDDFALLLPEPEAEDVVAKIVASFDAVAPSLCDPVDARRGFIEVCDRTGELRRFPLLAISLGIATTARRRFQSAGEVAAMASETKQRAKADSGSSWHIDRRARSAQEPTRVAGAPPQVTIIRQDEKLRSPNRGDPMA